MEDFENMPLETLKKRLKLYEFYLQDKIKTGETLRNQNLLDEHYHRSQIEKDERIIEEIKKKIAARRLE